MATIFAMLSTATADLTLTAPNASSFVTSGGLLPIAWTYSGPIPPNPPTISIELSRVLFNGPLALFSNLQTTSGGASWAIPKLGFVGTNFSIILVANVNNVATIYSQGPSFTILPEGTLVPVTQSSNHNSSSSSSRWLVSGLLAVIAPSVVTLLNQL
ncbi:hypothetical protein BGZ76_011344 [Entomortierella beljakovae]|nr:hypothetical protein BGZ76_011344 [Entomortierella beljakovae]